MDASGKKELKIKPVRQHRKNNLTLRGIYKKRNEKQGPKMKSMKIQT